MNNLSSAAEPPVQPGVKNDDKNPTMAKLSNFWVTELILTIVLNPEDIKAFCIRPLYGLHPGKYSTPSRGILSRKEFH